MERQGERGGKDMTITVQLLERLHACADQVAIFAREWPEGAEITTATVARAGALGLNRAWLARCTPGLTRADVLALARGCDSVDRARIACCAPGLERADVLALAQGCNSDDRALIARCAPGLERADVLALAQGCASVDRAWIAHCAPELTDEDRARLRA